MDKEILEVRNRALEKIVPKIVLDELKRCKGYTTTAVILELLDIYDLSDCEREEVLDIICNSKLYNYVNTQSGIGYFFGKSKEDIKYFIKNAGISENDSCWRNYVYTFKGSEPLNWFVEE